MAGDCLRSPIVSGAIASGVDSAEEVAELLGALPWWV